MARKVWFQLVDAATRGAYANTQTASVSSDGVSDIDDLCNLIWRNVKAILPPHVIAANLRVYANRAAYDEENTRPLRASAAVDDLGKDDEAALIVVVPPPQRSRVAVESAAAQWEKLLNTLEWKEPKRLCTSSGQDWLYQGAPELVEHLVQPLVRHYNAWQRGDEDKQNHAINLVLSGPGTGKSRMLDEMKALLCAAATRSKDQSLVDRMQNAYVFRVTFENGTSATGSLINRDFPELDVSYRMLYQLSKKRHETEWSQFLWELNSRYSNLPLTIGKVLSILAELEKIDKVKDMTVILCVDGLQKHGNDGSKECNFYRVLASICSFLNSSKVFAVCVCSATVQKPIRQALADSPQKRVILVPPPLRGHEILTTTTRIERQLVDDMGGHGRALETLNITLSRYTKVQLEEADPIDVVKQVLQALEIQYGDVFNSPLFDDKTNCQEVLVAILSRRRYGVFEKIGRTTLTVDEIRSFGLFRLSEEGYLECAFILLVKLMQKLPKKRGQKDNFEDHLTHSVFVWQRFEEFVAFYREVKSIAYCETSVALSEFHEGARFGAINNILITEPSSRAVVEAIHRQDTQSSAEDWTFHTNRDGVVNVADMNSIVINGTSASAGDIFMRVQLAVHDQQVHCNEVIQCKLLQTKQKVNEDAYAKERAKAANDSDVFLLVTPAQSTEFDLPPRCGIVSANEFRRYFGPFASRAHQSFLEPPNINTASFQELRRVKGVGDATATKICAERGKRRFSSREDAFNRLFSNKKSKRAEILSYMNWDDVEPDL